MRQESSGHLLSQSRSRDARLTFTMVLTFNSQGTDGSKERKTILAPMATHFERRVCKNVDSVNTYMYRKRKRVYIC